jgi:hypothetical protein
VRQRLPRRGEYCDVDQATFDYYCPCSDGLDDGTCALGTGVCMATAVGETCVYNGFCGAVCATHEDCADFMTVMRSYVSERDPYISVRTPDIDPVGHYYSMRTNLATCSTDPNRCPGQCVLIHNKPWPVPGHDQARPCI